ncbi:MAG: hypothetical protein GF370_02255 [Candidatus Nealsonbacteria bacterium]|nr:hypothetical protein [Candidatus Nealsonbacteria bacterium]
MSLKEFIIKARKNTYAGKGELVRPPLVPGSKQLEFREREYFYRDIYFTDKNFLGTETVYKEGKVVWGMNYFGTTKDSKVFNFLKETLLKLAEDCRFGKGAKLENDPYTYLDVGEGTIFKFSGEERIFIDGTPVYELRYQGGKIV